MGRNHNNDGSSRNSFKTFDNSGRRPSPWSNLDEGPLSTIMMLLGLADFFAFRRVCKSWRSVAVSHVKEYISFRQPLIVSFSTDTENDVIDTDQNDVTETEIECYLEDFEGTELKIILPLPSGSMCVGLTCGYLIFLNRISLDFLLVNPFTSQELHFPNFPSNVSSWPSHMIRSTLVFLPSVSRWAFVLSQKLSHKIWFSLSNNQACWSELTSEFRIYDVHSFKGKIYVMTSEIGLFEVKLDPTPTLTLLQMKNIPDRFLRVEFVNSDKNLYMVSIISADKYDVYEIDFQRMEWVLTEKSELEHGFFLGDMKSSAAVNLDTWAYWQKRRFGHQEDIDETGKPKRRCMIANMWYFPHDCFKVNTMLLQ